MKRIVILGSTGSIGTQSLDIVQRLPGRFQIVGLAANNNAELLAQQAEMFDVPCVSIGTPERADALRAALKARGRNPHVLCGVEGMCEVATLPEADLVVVAVAGAIGIAPTHAALEAGKDIALASKEVLVAAGETTMQLVRERNCAILPIDSEHSALFQCLQGAPEKSVEKLLLTASGGPFRTVPAEALVTVTPEQALKHPTWNMGGLVTINSATLMNKALEIIEAHWLFDVPVEQIEVVVHPQSIVHSMVRFNDGSTLAQLGLPDMRLPIQYALVYPERINTDLPRMELSAYANLTFEAPDEAKFPSLAIARRAVAQGGTLPAVMNAANETAVGLFLERKIPYPGIMQSIEATLERHTPMPPTLENVLEADRWAREETVRWGNQRSG
jgi:1-deoxy-D-xylulose-5-phosphate reductoisomerase